MYRDVVQNGIKGCKAEEKDETVVQTVQVPSVFDPSEFRQRGCQMVNYVADYSQNITTRRVFPSIEPGYLAPLIPSQAPERGEPWEDIVADIERVVMPGITHWHHPRFHAYFPCGTSWPSMCADLLTNGIGCIGFTWASSPACTELEVVMMDWLAKMLQLPDYFLSSSAEGGGVIQGSCSEATLIALFGARNRSISQYRETHAGATLFEAASKLVGYYSDQAHSSVERAGLISMLTMRSILSDPVTHEMTGCALREAIEEDLANGLVPFFCVATLGTTGCCALDRLPEIGQICQSYDIWLHVDAAYSGSAFICPEYRPLLDGIEYATSFVFNPHKWLLVNFDCSCVWYKSVHWITKSFSVNPTYLRHQHQGKVHDFRGDNNLTRTLYHSIEQDGRIHLVPSELHHPEEVFYIRFAVCYHSATSDDITYAANVILELTDKMMSCNMDLVNSHHVPFKSSNSSLSRFF